MLNVPSAASQEAIGELASHPAFHHAILHSIPQITKSLEDERRGVRSGAAGAIGRLSDHVVFHEAIQGSVSRVVALLNDGDGLVRSAAGVTIGRLARHAVFHKAIQDCFPNVLGLLKDEDELARSAGTETIGSLAAQPVFYDMIRDSVPQVLDLVKDKSGSVRSASAGAIGKLAEHRVFHNAILGSVSQVVALLFNDGNGLVRSAAANAIGKLVEHPIFHDSIQQSVFQIPLELNHFPDEIDGFVPQIIQWLNSVDGHVRSVGAEAIGKLAAHPIFHGALHGSVRQIIDLLDDVDTHVRSASTKAIGKLAKYPLFHDAVQESLPRVIELLKDVNGNIRSASAEAIGNIAEHSIFHDALWISLPHTIRLLKDPDAQVRSAGITALGTFAKHPSFHCVIETCVTEIVALLDDVDGKVLSACATVLSNLARHSLFHDAIEPCVLRIVGLLQNNIVCLRADTLAKFVEHHVVLDIPNIPQIIDLLDEWVETGTHPQLQWDTYEENYFDLPWFCCAEFLRRHGLRLHGTPDYHRDDSAHNKRFPTKTALDPFHPADDEDFIHRLDWDQPHCNKLGGFFQPTVYLNLALDRHLRNVVIKLLEGLWFMHIHCIAHGDIHPKNILWNHETKRPRNVSRPTTTRKSPFHSRFDFRMAYIDFGCSMKFTPGNRYLMNSGLRPPSEWAAPEQLHAEPYDVCAADVYMLGRVLKTELEAGRKWYDIAVSDRLHGQYEELLCRMTDPNPGGRPTASQAIRRLNTVAKD
ncbi:armadillo-type protein [Mycena olivaceomarginata]|nr:armadillo-type protein [Mycena olivaceomarginata]